MKGRFALLSRARVIPSARSAGTTLRLGGGGGKCLQRSKVTPDERETKRKLNIFISHCTIQQRGILGHKII